jgi:urea transport system permease protein
MIVLVPGLLAFVFGWFAFRSRVTGVYLSIITQALTYALLLAFFRNEMGFGGNNGLTDFKDILGFDVQAQRRARPVRDLGNRARAHLLSFAGIIVTSRSARCWSRCATRKAGRAFSATGSSTTSCSHSSSRR